MDKKSLKVLEYNKIIDLLSIKASSSLGLKYIEELTPSPNYEEVKDMLEVIKLVYPKKVLVSN